MITTPPHPPMPSPSPTFIPPATFTFSPFPSSPRLHIHPHQPTPRCSLIAVAGSTGGVGRLLVHRLLTSLSAPTTTTNNPPQLRVTAVRALARSPRRAAALLPRSAHLDVVSLSLPSTAAPAAPEHLRRALRGVAVLLICTGTTAFPTRAWSGGNTPRAVDDVGVYNLVSAVDKDCIKRVVLMSSIGTSSARAHAFPFSVLNLFGVLDAKRRGERHVVKAAREGGFAYAILRPGRLTGAPHSNIGALRKDDDQGRAAVRVERGDSITGDVSRATAADALLFAATWDPSKDLDLCFVNEEGGSPQVAEWEAMLERVQIVREGESAQGCVDV